jgi:hypothetical protein
VTPGMYAIWMTFDALDRTVDATDRRELSDRLDGAIVDLFSFCHCCAAFRFGLSQNHQSKNEMSANPTMPPTTPPAMGAAELFDVGSFN